MSKDPFDYALYIAGSSAGAIAPFLATSMAGGFALNAMKLNSVARAVQAATMGAGSYNVEFGSYIENYLAEKGYDLSNIESIKSALDKEDVSAIREKAFRRAAVVGAFDAISAWIAPIRLNPSNSLRLLSRAATETAQDVAVPASRLHRVGKGLENMTLQTTLQGVMGGAGEAFGQLVNGEEINFGEVFAETIGEFSTGPVEVVDLAYSANANFNRETAIAREAQDMNKSLQDISNVVTAVAAKLPDDGSLQQWCEAVGKDKTLFAFAQDVVDSGVIEKLQEVTPDLAKQIVEAAEKKSDVNVPVSEILKLSAKDEATARALLNDSRLTADGMSPNQAEKFLKEGKKGLVDKFNQIIDDAKPDIELRKAIKLETDKIVNELVSSGTPQNVADLQVLPWASWLAVRAKQTGMKPSEIMEKVRLRIEGEGTQVARTETAGIFTEKEIAEYNAISEPLKFDLVTVGKDENGKEHRVLGVDGSPDLMVMPEGIKGLKPLPVRLQEETANGTHIKKHEEQLLKGAGYESVEQAIWDIAQNWRWIAKGTRDGCVRLLRPLFTQREGVVRKGVLMVELQEVANAYRVGSVFVSDAPIKQKDILFDRQHYDRGPLSTNQSPTGLASTPASLKTDVPSVESIGQVVGNVKGESLFQRGYSYNRSTRARQAEALGGRVWSDWNKPALLEAIEEEYGTEYPEVVEAAKNASLTALKENVLYNQEWHHVGSNYRRVAYFFLAPIINKADAQELIERLKNYKPEAKVVRATIGHNVYSGVLNGATFRYIDETGKVRMQTVSSRYKDYDMARDIQPITNPNEAQYVIDSLISVSPARKKRSVKRKIRFVKVRMKDGTERYAKTSTDKLARLVPDYQTNSFRSEKQIVLGADAEIIEEMNESNQAEFAQDILDKKIRHAEWQLDYHQKQISRYEQRIADIKSEIEGLRVGGRYYYKLSDRLSHVEDWLVPEEKAAQMITRRLAELRKIRENLNPANINAIALMQSAPRPLTQRDVARALEQLGYHGSPYHFDRFPLSHIGSGEGAQAHGWGLYFALSRRTAEGYRKRLAGASTYTYNGKSLHELHDELYKEYQAERKKPNSPDKLAKLDLLTSKMLLLTSFIIGGKAAAKVEKTAPKRYQDAYKWLTEEVYPNLKLEKGGKVYTVEIPDDDVMLREEKKISEQSEFIQNAVRKATADMKIKQDAEEVEDFLDGLEKYDLVDMPKTFEKIQQMFSNNDERLSSDVSIAQALKDTVHQDAVALYEWNKEDNDANDITVEEIESNCQNTLKECLAEITRMARKNGNVDIGGLTGREVYSLLNHEFLSARSTSLYLNKFGIKGMRYEGARDGECAVVWDEESIKTLNALEQSMQSGPRGTYMPQNTSDTNSMSGVMTLMQTRDKSTFLHESAHVWLDADTMLPKGIADIVFARRDSNQLRYQKGSRH